MCERLNETTSLLLTHKDEVSDYKWQTGDKILVLYFDDLGQEHLEVFEYFNNEFSNGTSNFQELDDECCVIAWEKIEAETEPEKIDFRLVFGYPFEPNMKIVKNDSLGRISSDLCNFELPENKNSLIVCSDGTVIEYRPKEQTKVKVVRTGEYFESTEIFNDSSYSKKQYESVVFTSILDDVWVFSDKEELEAVREFIKTNNWQRILRLYMPPMRYEKIIKIFLNVDDQRLTGRNKK